MEHSLEKKLEELKEKTGYSYDPPFTMPLIAAPEEYDFSLIIPIYNAEEYIKDSLGSALAQETTYRYELILIDDGSRDRSLELVRALTASARNVTVVSQENHGISYARNRGAALARGKWIGFMDNDDLLKKNYIQSLMDAATGYDADYVKCGYVSIQGGKRIEKHLEPAVLRNGIGVENILKYNSYIWGGCFKRSLWYGFCLPDGFWYEDMCTRFILMRRAGCIVCLGDVPYIKREHTANASRVLWNSASVKALDQLFLVLELLKQNRALGMPEDETLLKTVLHEYGFELWGRTRRLRHSVRVSAFFAASCVVNDLCEKCGGLEHWEGLEKKYLEAFWGKSFLQWEALSLGRLLRQKSSQ